jgi:hypothetical protein
MEGELRCIVCGDTEDIDPDTSACDSCSRKYADTVGQSVAQRKLAYFRRDLKLEVDAAEYDDTYLGLRKALELFDSHFGE